MTLEQRIDVWALNTADKVHAAPSLAFETLQSAARTLAAAVREEAVTENRKVMQDALNYIRHVGANHVMRGQPHPQQWIVDELEAVLKERKI